MPVTLAEFMTQFHQWYPLESAEPADPVGLVWGDPDQAVGKVLLAVDSVPAVADEAASGGYDLLVVHHPLFFRPVSSVAATTFKGRTLATLARSGCALLTAHTNADVARGGVSDALARRLGLTDLMPLSARPTDASFAGDQEIGLGERGLGERGLGEVGLGEVGLGRIGRLEPTTLEQFARRVAAVLPETAGGVRVAGDPDLPIDCVAVCGGAGDGLLAEVAESPAQVYLTSDLRHHVASEFAEETGKALIDVAHWAAEWTWLPVAAERIAQTWGEEVSVTVSTLSTDPWRFCLNQPSIATLDRDRR